MIKIEDESMINRKFNHWTVLQFAGTNKKKKYMLCKCDCGTVKKVCKYALINETSKSCGCIDYKCNLKHGMEGTRIYRIWQSMRQRCQNKNHRRYKDYGGRGITVCKEWLDLNNFYKWAIKSGYSDKLTIDRINNDGNYEPTNCRWADTKQQAQNRRTTHLLTFNGKTQCILEWERELGISNKLICYRLKKGYPIEKVLSKQSLRKKKDR